MAPRTDRQADHAGRSRHRRELRHRAERSHPDRPARDGRDPDLQQQPAGRPGDGRRASRRRAARPSRCRWTSARPTPSRRSATRSSRRCATPGSGTRSTSWSTTPASPRWRCSRTPPRRCSTGSMSVLLKGPYFLTQTLLPLLADGGAIVNISSNSALAAATEPGYSAYGSMKGGLAVLTRYMAKELSPRGIRVNAVAPGSTRTRLARQRLRALPRGDPGARGEDRARPGRRTRRHRHGHRGAARRRRPLDHRAAHRGLGRLRLVACPGSQAPSGAGAARCPPSAGPAPLTRHPARRRPAPS